MVSPVLNPSTTTTTNFGRLEAILLWEDWRERRSGWEVAVGGGSGGLFENSCAPQSVLLQW